MNKNYYLYILTFIFLLLSFDVDYRLSPPSQSSTTDDASYYYHADTLASDLDFDYSNQIAITEVAKNDLYLTPKGYVPKHALGSGILATPFILFGNFISDFISQEYLMQEKIKYYIYSLSTVSYFFISIYLLNKIGPTNQNKKPFSGIVIFLFSFSSSLGYYSFERHSMSHVYEFFTITILLFLCTFNDGLSKKPYLIGLVSILPAFIRWTNISFIFLPIALLVLKKRSLSTLLKNRNYFFGLFTGLSIFSSLNYLLYGIFVFNPFSIYKSQSGTSSMSYLLGKSDEIKFNLDYFVGLFSNFINILVGQEFGLLYFSPIIFAYFYILIFKKKLTLTLRVLFLLTGSLPILVSIVWQSTGSSYGYRYLIPLVSLGIYLSQEFLNLKEIKFLIMLSVFSTIAIFMFETSEMTSLSSYINSFGQQHNYSQPKYLSGVLLSISSIKNIIFGLSTSLFSVLVIKISDLMNLVPTLRTFILSNFEYNSKLEDLLDFSINLSFFEIFFTLTIIHFGIKKNNLNSMSMFR